MASKAILVFTVAIGLCARSTAQNNQNGKVAESEGDLLKCGELTDLAQLSLCLSKTVSRVKTQPQGYGYPYGIAPTLPPFLIGSKGPQSDNDISAERRIDSSNRAAGNLVKRIQIYSEPGYRNFLDLDATLSQRVVEYRPIFGEFPVPVLVHPVREPSPYGNGGHRAYYYNKPTKPRGGPKKAYDGYYKNGGYPSEEYNAVVSQKEREDGYSKRKYGDEYSNQKSTGYDPNYFVPANSPIIGDIRRSLLDYTGARDLIADEGDYLSRNGVNRRLRIKEIERDYYPFRRSDVFVVKDLEAEESNKPV